LGDSTLEDPWIALDKLEHFALCAAVVLAVYCFCTLKIHLSNKISLLIGIVLSLAAATVKELGDALGVSRCAAQHTGDSTGSFLHFMFCFLHLSTLQFVHCPHPLTSVRSGGQEICLSETLQQTWWELHQAQQWLWLCADQLLAHHLPLQALLAASSLSQDLDIQCSTRQKRM